MNRRAFLAGAAAVPVVSVVPFGGVLAEAARAAPCSSRAIVSAGGSLMGHVGFVTADGLKIRPITSETIDEAHRVLIARICGSHAAETDNGFSPTTNITSAA